MTINSLPRTHYERAYEFLKEITDIDVIFQEIQKDLGDSPSFKEFCIKLSDSTIRGFTSDNDKFNTLLANILFHTFMMKKNHEKIYHVTPQLAVKLAQTDINIDSHFIKSPFREIYISIDPGLFSVTDPQGVYPVHGFYVYFNDQDGVKELRIMASAILPNTEEIAFNDTLFYYKMYFKEGKIKEQVKDTLAIHMNKKEELDKYGGAANMDHIEEFTYFVINTLLYITSKDPDVREQLPVDFKAKIEGKKSPGKIKKLMKMAKRYTTYPIVVVGGSITDAMNQVDEVRRAGGIGNWKLTMRVYVSGHWRAQWYGSAEAKESKVIFIEPYYKGPELAEVINKKFQVGSTVS